MRESEEVRSGGDVGGDCSGSEDWRSEGAISSTSDVFRDSV